MRGTFEELSEAAHFAGAASPEQIAEYERLSIERNNHHEAMMELKDYAAFVASKERRLEDCGIAVDDAAIHESLFPFQRALVRWAAKRGRGALFCGTGLGKTRMQIEWARLVASESRALILAPIAVGAQTIREAAVIGVTAHDLRSDWTPRPGINVANYQSLHKINPADFDAVVLDESSILKNFTGATRNELIAAFADTPYRLCATATPAPNDISEIGNHAEFLGIMTRAEMNATWFVHDEQEWRLKGHAEQAFWRWLASWGMFVRRPSDLGFDDGGYDLPPLDIQAVMVGVPIATPGHLFFTGMGGVKERSQIRKATADARIREAVNICNGSPESWIVWCGLNAESEAASKAIAGAVEVTGSMSDEQKEAAIYDFVEGRARVLVSKPGLCGFGMNFQHCHNTLFLGLSDSYEAYYQAIRRQWRFGQKHKVNVRIVLADIESEVLANVKAKEMEADAMAGKIVDAVRDYERAEIGNATRERDTRKRQVQAGPSWEIRNGDCIEELATLPDKSIDLSVFSPPFSSLYTYSNNDADIGNCSDHETFLRHYAFLASGLLRVTKPGRLACVHIANIPAMLSRDGYIGIKDLRGDIIRAHIEAGWIFHGEITIDKCPQAQAIRTKSKSLLFAQKERDSSWLRPALADYVCVFRAPGENQVPILNADVTRDDWILWARPIWYGIKEADTLQVAEARDEKDERHVCPLQLGTIERCIMLWSNRGETVLSPFAGIGSEVYQAIMSGRKGIGFELKESYWRVACANADKAERKMAEGTLFAK